MRTKLVAATAVGILSLIGAGSATAHARSAGGVLIPQRAHARIPVHGGTVTSLNWSGYAVTPSTSNITAVSSTFTVPTAGLLPPGFAATWTGIGGYTSSDLIQAGTTEDSLPSNPLLGDQYYAWYELLPAGETQLTNCSGDPSCTVTPGDDVTVNISQVAGTTWSISMTDAGHWTWTKDVTYSSTQSSAEWILEAPTVVAQSLLANVGTVAFGPTNTYTAGGTTNTIAAGNPTQLDLSPLPIAGLLDEATPSPLASDGQSFNDCAYTTSCPTL
jgi:Peptidase A4 family